jgi:hypothetical protein
VQTARPADAPADDAAAGTVYVLTPVHDRKALTERFLRCLIDQTDRDYHLVLVDDGSRDGTAEMARSMIPSATIIRGSGNWWWAGSLEQARRWLLRQPSRPGDLVLIANDDTTFGPTSWRPPGGRWATPTGRCSSPGRTARSPACRGGSGSTSTGGP